MKQKQFKIILLMLAVIPVTVAAEGLSISQELLYLRASEETASTFGSVISTPTERITKLKEANVSFNHHLGCRLGVDYEPECEWYDTRLYWTYFHPKTTTHIPAGNKIIFSEFFSGFQSLNFFFGADADWRLKLNMFDVDLGHTICIDPCFAFRPSIGLKGGSINQKINCFWNAGVFTAAEKLKNNFTGLGPTLGLEGDWNVYQALHLFGDFSTAYLWGHWRTRDVYIRPSALLGFIPPTTITTVNASNPRLGTMMFKYRVGLGFEHEITHTRFQLAYEIQFWPNQLRLPTFQQLPVHGDLTIQGISCRISADL